MSSIYNKKLEDLLTENKKLYDMNNKLNELLVMKTNTMIDKDNKICDLQSEIINLKETLKMQEYKMRNLEIKMHKSINLLKNELNRKDILNNKLVGSNKDLREIQLKNELNKVYFRNNVLVNFIMNIFNEVEGDFESFYKILDLVEDKDDEILKVFFKQIQEKIEYKCK